MQASKKVNFYLKAFIFYLSCNYYTSEEIRKDKQVKHIEKTCLRPSCNCESYKKFETAICLKKDLSLKIKLEIELFICIKAVSAFER